MIVGFPGETDADFEETLSLVEEVQFDSAFTFIYSPRSGTEAASLPDQVPDEVKHERLEILQDTKTELEPVLLLYDADPPVSRPPGDPVIDVDEAYTGAVIEKIVAGKIEAYYKDVALVHQAWVREPKKTIGELIKEASAKVGENIQVRRFVRFQMGEE